MESLFCHGCAGEVELIDKIKRADTCEHCGIDLRCCKNCHFFEPHVHNQCRESSTLWEPDKEKANFCAHFGPRKGEVEVEDKDAALSKLANLFK